MAARSKEEVAEEAEAAATCEVGGEEGEAEDDEVEAEAEEEA